MYDGGKIITGIVIFLIIVTFPMWYNVAIGNATYKPEPKIIAKEKNCVAQNMRTNHMEILNDWRDTVVRKGNRYYTTTYTNYKDGKIEMSLSHTCMDCHSNKSQFCDKCHNYLSVDPYCWECHVEPKEDN